MSVIQNVVLNQGNSTSISGAYTSNVASGNILVALAGQNGNTTLVIGDTRSNAWVRDASSTNPGNSSGSESVVIWHVASSLSGATTVTISGGVASADWSAALFEINGYSTTIAVGSGTGTSTTPSVPSMSFGSGAFLVAIEDTSNAQTTTATAGFTKLSGINKQFEYANTVASPSTFGWVVGVNVNWAEVAASFDVLVTAVAAFKESGPKRQYRREGRMR